MPRCHFLLTFPAPFVRALARGAACICLLAVLAATSLAQDDDRLPVPSADDQAEIRELIEDVYADAFEAANNDTLKLELAERLIADGLSTQDSPAGRFVLFSQARDLAADTNNLHIAFRAIENLDREYQIDGLAMKAELATELVGGLRRPGDRPQLDATARTVGATVELAVANNRFDLAIPLNEAFVDAARRTRSRLLAPAVEHLRQVKEAAEKFAAIEEVAALLAEDPINGDANLAVGKYECFVLQNWYAGLPKLALGSDETLQELAEAELGSDFSAAQQKELGDGWWEYTEHLTGDEQDAVRRHAAYWYYRAKPELTGLALALVEQRLEVADPLIPQFKNQSFDIEAVAAGDGWVEYMSRQNENDYGFSDSDHTAGASPAGEAGGSLKRHSDFTYYADTQLYRELSLEDTLAGSGELMIPSDDYCNNVRIGYFETIEERREYTALGIAAGKNHDNSDMVIMGLIVLTDSEAVLTDPISIEAGETYTWRFEWNPDSSTLTIEVFDSQGTSLGSPSVRLRPAQIEKGGTFDACGLSALPYDTLYFPQAQRPFYFYVDNFEYIAK